MRSRRQDPSQITSVPLEEKKVIAELSPHGHRGGALRGLSKPVAICKPGRALTRNWTSWPLGLSSKPPAVGLGFGNPS